MGNTGSTGGNENGQYLQGKPRVIVVGGGYAGTTVARLLDNEYNVVVIEKRSFMLHNIAGLRACVRPTWENYVCIPYTKLLNHGMVVQGEVIDVCPERNSVTVQYETQYQEVTYDYLVLATGSLNGFPGKLPEQLTDPTWTLHLYRSTQAAIREASTILILGGGPVGCELAAEIKSVHKTKAVYLVHNTGALCNNTIPPLPAKFQTKLYEQLRAIGVKVVLNDFRISSEIEAKFGVKGVDEEIYISANSMPFTDNDGMDFNVDLIFRCMGNRLNNKMLRREWLNGEGHVKVNAYLQVTGRGTDRIFACGDIADVRESKMAYYAQTQAKTVAKNIKALQNGKGKLYEYKSARSTSILVPVGPDGGSSVLEGYYAGPLVTSKIKSKELFVSRYWSELNQSDPRIAFRDNANESKNTASARFDILASPDISVPSPPGVSSNATVVIVGGGYAGIAAAKALDPYCRVIVLEKREFMLHNIAGLRACVRPGWERFTCIPYTRALTHGKVLKGSMVALDKAKRCVSMEQEYVEVDIQYDFLILATGTVNGFPGKLPSTVTQYQWTMELYKSTQQAIKTAASILIVGGGPVGCELAGEIKSSYPDKVVYLVHNNPKLCNNTQPALGDKFRNSLLKQLRETGVEVILDDYRINGQLERTFGQKRLDEELFIAGQQTSVVKDNGETITVDMVFRCLGNSYNNTAFHPTMLNEKGQLKVDEYLRVLGEERVYACGDINDVPESKQAYYANLQALHVAKNIRNQLANKSQSKYSPAKNGSMLVPVGDGGGSSELQGWYVGPFLTSKIKSADLFVSLYWKMLNQPTPGIDLSAAELDMSIRGTIMSTESDLSTESLPTIDIPKFSPVGKRRVVIVGGGYAGVELCKLLDSSFDITLIERKEFMLHSISGLRSCVVEGHETKSCIPYQSLLTRGSFVKGSAANVDLANRCVSVIVDIEERDIPFDFLVLATGSQNGFPAKLPPTVVDMRTAYSMYTSAQAAIKQSESVLIVGGGPVGCELAGEIISAYPNKIVHLITNAPQLLNHTVPPVSSKVKDRLLEALAERGVRVILRDQAVHESIVQRFGWKELENELFIQGDNMVFTTDSGVSITVDLIFRCVGNYMESSYVDPSWLTENGYLRVNSHLQVLGYQNIFAAGDIADLQESKLAFAAKQHAKVAAKNIKLLSAGKRRLAKYTKPAAPSMLVSLGPNDGVSELQGFPAGAFLTSKLKSSDLLISKTWSDLNLKVPGITNGR